MKVIPVIALPRLMVYSRVITSGALASRPMVSNLLRRVEADSAAHRREGFRPRESVRSDIWTDDPIALV